MKKVYDALENEDLLNDARLVLQVHDELVYEVKKDKIEKISKIIEEALKNIIPDEFLKGKKSIPFLITSSFGNNWGELK